METKAKSKKNLIILICCACAFIFLLFMIAVIIFFSKIGLLSASKIELSKAEGKVSVQDKRDKEIKVKDGIKLHEGYDIQTEHKSYAYLSLDKKRMVKMGEASDALITSSGKKLSIKLTKGDIFFNIEKKLKKNESFTITTSTMTMGIRGTAGYVQCLSSNHAIFSVLEGKVECSVINPNTFEIKNVEIKGGEQADIAISDSGIITVNTKKINVYDIPKFVRNEVFKSESLQKRITVENNGIIVNQILQNANGKDDIISVKAFDRLASYASGDIVTFGSYEQDNNKLNGKEPIEWIVLQSNDSRILLLSKYILDTSKYNDSPINLNWRDSSIRKWLNEKFIFNAFSMEERAYITERTIDEVPAFGYPVTGGAAFKETVHLLSAQDLEFIVHASTLSAMQNAVDSSQWKTFAGNLYKAFPDIVAEPTAYAKAQGVKTNTLAEVSDGSGTDDFSYSMNKGCYWLLRPLDDTNPLVVDQYGYISSRPANGTAIKGDNPNIGVRPMIYINKKPK